MQSLRLKLRKRKYKLSMNRGSGGASGPELLWGRGRDGTGVGMSANANAEWEFENFSPWIFSGSKKESEEPRSEAEADEEDEKYWGPRPQIQGLLTQSQAAQSSPTPTSPAGSSPAGSSRYGILSYLPRRPSSWSPTSPAAPPVPPHAWQPRRRSDRRDAANRLSGSPPSQPPPPPPPPRHRHAAPPGSDLRRSASCYQEAKDQKGKQRVASDSMTELHLTESVATASLGARGSVVRSLSRAQGQHGSVQHLAECREQQPQRPNLLKVEPVYSKPMRCKSAHESGNKGEPGKVNRPLRKHSNASSLRPLHNGLKSTLASSESHLSGSYTVLSDDIDRSASGASNQFQRRRAPPPPVPISPSPPPPPVHRSPMRKAHELSPPPPPVPPHAPGVVCTRISPLLDAPADGSNKPSEDGGTRCEIRGQRRER